ncbi:fasciclin domain-containing protein [Antarcticibacterium arcticum]|uniref:Fasciclin domain-containing protein n=1 Tax=Antarcticibacterium arcticum TaxID=2585771 RepID=A0A5B8YI97_9FLAO|nr:fasciclin domain-containing protein [Antarcticibacterium arcticum]QED37341.1 fasciclin domain-containing protein [Antarcticibacterium arcticum]
MKTKPLLFAFLMFTGTLIFVGCKEKSLDDAPATTSSQTETTETSSNRGQAFIEDENSEANALRTAINSPDHSTLVAAVQAAGVENALVNVGPLSVFAPTNAAFEKLPAGTVDDLLKPENKEKLAYILKNHVAPSNYPIETLMKNVDKGRALYMASGESVPVTREGDDIYVGGTKIVGSIKVSNGWVHVVEDIILPKNTN